MVNPHDFWFTNLAIGWLTRWTPNNTQAFESSKRWLLILLLRSRTSLAQHIKRNPQPA